MRQDRRGVRVNGAESRSDSYVVVACNHVPIIPCYVGKAFLMTFFLREFFALGA